MRRALTSAVLAVTIGLALAGCSSGGGSSANSAATGTASKAAVSTAASTVASALKDGGKVDCSGLTKDDLAAYLLYTQVLAQVRDQAAVQALRDHTISDYTPDKFSAILTKLQVLAGHAAAGFGDPAESLAYYAKVNDIVGQMLATSGDVPQSLFDQYTAAVGDTTAAISKQLPINAALSVYCPN